MEKENTLGLNIKKYRQDKNVSRKELANEIGCSVYAIEKYEQGQRTPSINTLMAIGKALDVDPTNFLDKEEREELQKLSKKVSTKVKNFVNSITPIILSDDDFLYDNEKFQHLEKDQIEFYYKNTFKPYKNIIENTQNLPKEAIEELEEFAKYMKFKYSNKEGE